tara:strand:- start:2505 stop:3437 length:933 start_codon:yes stop_codon:yes gene_type:complete
MHKILVTCPPMLKQINKFESRFKTYNFDVDAPEVVQTLSEKELIEILPNYHGWIIGDDPATYKVFQAGKNGKLKAAVKWGIGVDNVDFRACHKLDIPITNTPGMFNSEVADLAMCYLLGLSRDAFNIDREVRQGNWLKPSGISLSGKVLGIIGLGDIGKSIAKRARAHDMRIIGWDPFAKSLPNYIELKRNWPLGLDKCDFIVFACALNKENHHMLSNSLLTKFKPGVRVINISRGQLIDESALINGLKKGIIDSAALDVYEDEPLSKDHKIIDYPRCILGSHNASNTIEAVIRASDESLRLLYNMLNKK